jgi:surfactin synthase thioesterase subunit
MEGTVSMPDAMAGWFVPGPAASAGSAALPRIFCFAYAGGDPRTYLDWQPAVADDAALVAVCPPGKGPRAGESLPGFDELADRASAAIAAAARRDNGPIYLFGHSFGGLLAFEVARRLRDLPALRQLVVSGISAPSLLPSRRIREIAALEGREFAEALGFFGQFPPEVLADEDVLALLLPGLMADFRMAVGYRYRPAPPLDIAVSVMVGRDDPHVGMAEIQPWQQECRTPPTVHLAEGGHFHFDQDPSAVTGLLRAVVQADHHVELI